MKMRDILAILEYLDGRGIVVTEDDETIKTELRRQFVLDEDE